MNKMIFRDKNNEIMIEMNFIGKTIKIIAS